MHCIRAFSLFLQKLFYHEKQAPLFPLPLRDKHHRTKHPYPSHPTTSRDAGRPFRLE